VDAVSQGTPAIVPSPYLGSVDSDSVVIGRNLAMIAVPAGNPGQVSGLDAFAADAALDTAICGADSPYGNLATLVLEREGVTPDPARVGVGCDADAVAQVARGDLDAALVFRSFLEIPGGVEVINIPDDQNLVIDIRYAPVGDAEDSETGSFPEFLKSDQATDILTHEGFLP
jgi:molybdate transport system substrate-binding protein